MIGATAREAHREALERFREAAEAEAAKASDLARAVTDRPLCPTDLTAARTRFHGQRAFHWEAVANGLGKAITHLRGLDAVWEWGAV